ncbi:MAG: cobalamin biosynthesis protein [Pseudomonadota bacterium]|nr:cobalamin biosynthesis protein [Pseudomonadota bacterium]
MSVTLIAAVVALVLGHLAPAVAAGLRQYGWYGDWLRWLDTRLPASFWRGQWGISLALLLPLLLVGLVQAALEEPLLGFGGLLFGIAVLFYTWGPRDLDVDVDAIMDAPDPKARRAAAARLWPRTGTASLDGGALAEATFRSALRRWFGVLFWFLVLGAFGAMLYRLTQVAADGIPEEASHDASAARSLPPETLRGARTLLSVLEWPVAQLMTLALALVGNFDSVLGAWRSAGGTSFSLDNRFLGAAARASVNSELAEEAADYEGEEDQARLDGIASVADLPELRDAMSLIWRSLLVWLAVLALFVIAGFVN